MKGKGIRIAFIFTCLFILQGVFAGQENTKDSLFQSYIKTGDSLLFKDKFQEARNHYSLASEGFETFHYSFLYSRYKIAYSYRVEGRQKECRDRTQELLITMDKHGIPDSSFYYLVQAENISLNYGRFQDHQEYLVFEKSVLKYYDKLGSWEKARVNVCLAEILKNRMYPSLSNEYASKLMGSSCTDQYLIDYAKYLMLLNFFVLREYQRVVEIGFELQNSDNISTYRLLAKMGMSCLRLGDVEQAIELYEMQMNYASQKQLPYVYVYLANCYLDNKEEEKAYEYYMKSYSITHKQSCEKNQLYVSTSGMVYYFNETKQYEQSRAYVEELVSYIDALKLNNNQKLSVLVRVSRFYYKLEEFDKIVMLLDKYFPKEKTHEFKPYFDTFRLYQYKALSYYRNWQKDSSDIELLSESYVQFRKAVSQLSNSIGNAHAESSMKYAFDRMYYAYRNLIITGIDIYSATKSDSILQQVYRDIDNSKAVEFNYELENSRALQKDDLFIELEALEADLKKRILFLRKSINELSYSELELQPNRASIKDLNILTARYDSLRNVISQRTSGYNKNFAQPDNILIGDAQSKLASDQVLINYYIGEGRLFAFFINNESYYFKELLVEGDIQKQLLDYRELIENPHKYSYKEGFDKFSSSSFSLYKQLLKPFENDIKGKRLLIVPYGELNYVPFETLITDSISFTGANRYNKLSYLMKKNAVSVLYTPQQLLERKDRITGKSRFAGFAPDYKGNPHGYRLLENNKREVDNIQKYYKGTVYGGNEAGKKNFIEDAPDFPIVHLAGHVVLDDKAPMFSKLIFSPGSGSGESLYIYELIGTRFKAKLLVLSGCNTGHGEVFKGEGVLNLARTFFYSGINNIIVTQWEIADKSSSELMSGFYKNLSDGASADEALQKAKIEYLQFSDPMRHHPYYWSGYILVGDPIESIKKKPVTIVVFVGAVLLLLFALGIKKARTKSLLVS